MGHDPLTAVGHLIIPRNGTAERRGARQVPGGLELPRPGEVPQTRRGVGGTGVGR